MKRTLLFLSLCLIASLSFAQASFLGVKSGVGFTTTNNSSLSPSFGAEYQISPFRHIYLGGSLFLEGYSFSLHDNTYEKFGGQGYTLSQNSSYLFIAPKVDATVGRHEYFHFYISGGMGFLINGEQTITATTPRYPGQGFFPGVVYDTGNTSKNINHIIFRLSMGATQHIQVFPFMDLTCGEELGIIPTWISKNTYGGYGDQAMDIKTNYVSLSIGLMYKRNWQKLKQLRSWGGY